MPASAIASGCVDFILTPGGIAKEIARIRHHPYIADRFNPEAAQVGDGSDMEQIFRLLRRTTTVDFSGYKSPTIARRIQRRMALQKIDKLKDYGTFLHREPQEVQALYHDLLINVTSFFRNPEAFAALRQIAYPAILQARTSASGAVRVWVPGCSTGEETYSHAISLVEFLGDRKADIPIQLFGTDLGQAGIDKARAGVYPESIAADVSPQRLQRFFTKVEGGYRITKTIRDMCVFARHNLLQDPPFSRIDIISCRNVLIYFGLALQKRVMPIFHYALKPRAFLLLGRSEGILGTAPDLFELMDRKHKIYCRKSTPARLHFDFAASKH